MLGLRIKKLEPRKDPEFYVGKIFIFSGNEYHIIGLKDYHTHGTFILNENRGITIKNFFAEMKAGNLIIKKDEIQV